MLVAVLWTIAAVPVPAQPAPPTPTGSGQSSSEATGVPVEFAGERLFSVYTPLGPFSPQDRAAAIAERLKRLTKDPLAKIEGIVVVDRGSTTDVVLGQTSVMSVTDGDAQVLGLSRDRLAEEYALKIQQVLKKAREEASPRALLLKSLYAVLDTAVLFAVLVLLHKVFPKLYARLQGGRGTRIRAIKIQNVELVSADLLVSVLVGIIQVIRIFGTLVIFYFYVSSVLGIFPQTRSLSAELFGAMLSVVKMFGRGVVAFAPNIFAIAFIVIVARYVIKVTHLIFRGVERGAITFAGFHREWADPTYKIVRFLMIIIAAIAIFPYIPASESAGFRGVSVFVGLLLSLGSAAAVGNIVAGVFLTYMRPFRVGHYVKIADTVGDVIEKTLLVTRIRTIKNVDITIPNGMVLASHIVNYSSIAKERGVILHTNVTIGYSVPWRKVHDLLLSAARVTPRILLHPEPFVFQTSLNDFFVTYELNAYTDQASLMVDIYSELHQNIQDKFNEAGVEIMSPHYAQIRDGNRTTIPEKYLPDTYRPPAFRFAQDGIRTEAQEGRLAHGAEGQGEGKERG